MFKKIIRTLQDWRWLSKEDKEDRAQIALGLKTRCANCHKAATKLDIWGTCEGCWTIQGRGYKINKNGGGR